MIRLLVFAVAIVFVGGFAFLTYAAVSEHGFTILSLLSVIVIFVMGVGILGGIVGALRNPPRR